MSFYTEEEIKKFSHEELLLYALNITKDFKFLTDRNNVLYRENRQLRRVENQLEAVKKALDLDKLRELTSEY